jgi:hypothetical protein
MSYANSLNSVFVRQLKLITLFTVGTIKEFTNLYLLKISIIIHPESEL